MRDLESIKKMLAPLFSGSMGVELLAAEPERVTARMRVRPDLCTTGGNVHGGALTAFADTLGAVATFVNLPEGAGTTTIESKTNFLGAAAANTFLSAECTALHKGRTTMVWQTRIVSESGKLCAVVIQTQLVLAARPPG